MYMYMIKDIMDIIYPMNMHVSQCILWPHPAHQYEGTLAQLPRRLLLKINTQDTPMMAS
jgi:hypothetical protein